MRRVSLRILSDYVRGQWGVLRETAGCRPSLCNLYRDYTVFLTLFSQSHSLAVGTAKRRSPRRGVERWQTVEQTFEEDSSAAEREKQLTQAQQSEVEWPYASVPSAGSFVAADYLNGLLMNRELNTRHLLPLERNHRTKQTLFDHQSERLFQILVRFYIFIKHYKYLQGSI